MTKIARGVISQRLSLAANETRVLYLYADFYRVVDAAAAFDIQVDEAAPVPSHIGQAYISRTGPFNRLTVINGSASQTVEIIAGSDEYRDDRVIVDPSNGPLPVYREGYIVDSPLSAGPWNFELYAGEGVFNYFEIGNNPRLIKTEIWLAEASDQVLFTLSETQTSEYQASLTGGTIYAQRNLAYEGVPSLTMEGRNPRYFGLNVPVGEDVYLMVRQYYSQPS